MIDFQVIKTQPGSHLTVYYHSMVGEKFELKVHDGNTTNATVAAILDQLTVVNQAVTPTFSTGHELYIRFRYNGRNGATVKFVITDDKGKIVVMVRRLIFFILKGSKAAYTWT